MDEMDCYDFSRAVFFGFCDMDFAKTCTVDGSGSLALPNHEDIVVGGSTYRDCCTLA